MSKLENFMKMGYDQNIMLGYVTIEREELKVKDLTLYQAYYCGICKAIGKRLGQLPRMTLNYDAVFLAMILAGISEDKDQVLREHCIAHPFQKRSVVYENREIDYAADVMVILSYHKFLDDWKDEKKKAALAGKTVLAGSYGKLRRQYPELCFRIEEDLNRLSSLEKLNSGNLDQATDVFASIMENLFTGFLSDPRINRILAQLGRALGKWIYIIDALDDYADDLLKGRYNPLCFRQNGLEGIEDLLYNILAEIASAYDLLDLRKNQEVVENIIFMGIRSQTDRILSERTKEDEQSI